MNNLAVVYRKINDRIYDLNWLDFEPSDVVVFDFKHFEKPWYLKEDESEGYDLYEKVEIGVLDEILS